MAGGKGSAQSQRRRRTAIGNLVVSSGSLSIEEIADSMSVSVMTVYRDVAQLEEMGIVSLVRGTVHALASTMSEAAAVFRAEQNVTVKKAMARVAAAMVTPGASIFLDDSTSGLFLAEELLGRGPAYIITNSLLVAQKVSDDPEIGLVVTGGEYQHWASSLSGPSTVRSIYNTNADFCFLSTSGILGTRCFHPNADLAAIKTAMIESATQSVLLIDHSKFARRSVHRFADLKDFDAIITDSQTNLDDLELLRSQPGTLWVAETD